MENNLQKLQRIGKELENINRDLSGVIHKQNSSNFDTISLDKSSSFQDLKGDSAYTTAWNLEMADLAYEEFLVILSDIKLSYQMEEKDLISRASSLKRGTETFKKMSSEALVNLSIHWPTLKIKFIIHSFSIFSVNIFILIKWNLENKILLVIH